MRLTERCILILAALGILSILGLRAGVVPPLESLVDLAEDTLEDGLRLAGVIRRTGGGNERGASASLKMLATAQIDFRSNDRDESGVCDFWRADVAGLFGLERSGDALKLIDLSVACADDRPASVYRSLPGAHAPKAGYLFRAIRHADEAVPDPNRFAFCAFPSSYPNVGRSTFIIDEGSTVLRKDLGHGAGVEVFPPDPGKEGWIRMD